MPVTNEENQIPSIVFIVPYRNRHQHKFFFSNYLTSILPETLNYEIYFSHQCDIRSFNRGATKNIGFIAVKNKYPNDYKNITFVFNDIDTLPFTNLFDYETTSGVVKHFYGFTYALGGIVSITGDDLEKTNGYPNFWGWGMEDNVLQKRCENNNISIDRSNFYKIGNPNIIHLFDGVSRIINQKDPYRATNDNGIDGIRTIHSLKYTIDTNSDNPIDNIHTLNLSNIFVINIKSFLTGVRFENDTYHNYDLREPLRQIIHPSKIKPKVINHITNDWSNIPYYPTSVDKKKLIEQHGAKKTEEIIQQELNTSTRPQTRVQPQPQAELVQPRPQSQTELVQPRPRPQTELVQPRYRPQAELVQAELVRPQAELVQAELAQPESTNAYDNLLKNYKIQQYNENQRKLGSNKRIIPRGINKYSPEYAKIIAPNRRVGVSANIRIGGVY